MAISSINTGLTTGVQRLSHTLNMMTSSNGNIFRVTGPFWEEFTGHRWIPLTKASNAELYWFLWSAPEQTVEQTIETPVICDAITLIITLLLWKTPNEQIYNITEKIIERFNTFEHIRNTQGMLDKRLFIV